MEPLEVLVFREVEESDVYSMKVYFTLYRTEISKLNSI